MDQNLKELCLAIIDDKINGENFTNLLIETGIKLESFEWDIANKMLGKRDEMKVSLGSNQYTTH